MFLGFREKVFSILGLRWRDRYGTIERTPNFHTDPPKEARPRGSTPGAGYLQGVGTEIRGPLYCTISVPGAQPQNQKNFLAEIREHLLTSSPDVL